MRMVRPLRNIMRIESEAALAELGLVQPRGGNAQLNAGAARWEPAVGAAAGAPAASIGDLMKTFVAMLQVIAYPLVSHAPLYVTPRSPRTTSAPPPQPLCAPLKSSHRAQDGTCLQLAPSILEVPMPLHRLLLTPPALSAACPSSCPLTSVILTVPMMGFATAAR